VVQMHVPTATCSLHRLLLWCARRFICYTNRRDSDIQMLAYKYMSARHSATAPGAKEGLTAAV
jgi:hypothetical protein